MRGDPSDDDLDLRHLLAENRIGAGGSPLLHLIGDILSCDPGWIPASRVSGASRAPTPEWVSNRTDGRVEKIRRAVEGLRSTADEDSGVASHPASDGTVETLTVAVDYAPRKRADVLELDMGDGVVLYDSSSRLVHHLNPSA